MELTKPCQHCGKPFGPDPRWPRLFGKRKACSQYCGRRLRPNAFKTFWHKVNKDAPDGCWLWTASVKPNGYGHFCVGGKDYMSHRWSYELAHGPIPKGMHVLHSCDVPACVNPIHLRLGTHAENMRESASKLRTGMAKLNPDQVREIRRLIGTMQLKQIAAKFNINASIIWKIREGRLWTHVK